MWRLVVLLAAGCTTGPNAHYGVAYRISNGAAVLPPTASRGTTATLSYREEGGPIVRSIALFIAGLPSGPDVISSETTTYALGDGRYIQTTKTVTRDRSDAEIRAEEDQFNNVIAPGIRRNEIPLELELGVASPSLGGDTSGAFFSFMYRFPLAAWTGLAFGLNLASFTFHDRTINDVTNTGMTLSSTERMGNLGQGLVAMPIRITHNLRDRLSAYLQWDLNFLAALEDETSPLTLGLHAVLPFFSIKAFATTARFDSAATTFGIEGCLGY